MEFDWDEAKRRRVLAERGLDFIEGTAVFDGRNLLTVPSPHADEERWLSVGELSGRLVAVVWCFRDDRIRVITMRRARNEEKRRYQALFGE